MTPESELPAQKPISARSSVAFCCEIASIIYSVDNAVCCQSWGCSRHDRIDLALPEMKCLIKNPEILLNPLIIDSISYFSAAVDFQADGVTPITLRNVEEKCCCELNPQSSAIWLSDIELSIRH